MQQVIGEANRMLVIISRWLEYYKISFSVTGQDASETIETEKAGETIELFEPGVQFRIFMKELRDLYQR